MGDKILNVGKYELWNALFMADKSAKSEAIVELEKQLDLLMSKPGRVVINIRVEE